MFSKLSATETIYNAWQREPCKIFVLFSNIGATENAGC